MGVTDKIKLLDLNGQEAKLSLTYKTVLGGAATVLILLMICGYGGYELAKLSTEPFTYDFKSYERPVSQTIVFPFREIDFISGITLQTKDSTSSRTLDNSYGRFFIND
jgi:hypothetical protein